MTTGWLCPSCHKAHAPSVLTCPEPVRTVGWLCAWCGERHDHALLGCPGQRGGVDQYGQRYRFIKQDEQPGVTMGYDPEYGWKVPL